VYSMRTKQNERLQGFPDGWTALDEHGKPISDSKRYQMLGNSVAVPCVAYILQGMARHLREEGLIACPTYPFPKT